MSKDKVDILDQLNDLIDYTYKAEQQFKSLNSSHIKLNETINELLEFLPDALWVISDNNETFLLNSKAKELNNILIGLDYKVDNDFVYKNRSYTLRSNRNRDKTIIIVTDITDQKQKDRLAIMGQMSAHLSHEIRNPIGSISLIASTLFNTVDIKNKSKVYEILKAVSRVERIINATLIYSKEVVANKNSFILSELNTILLDEIEYYSYSKEVNFKFNFTDILFYGDINLLILLFTNLIFNAIDSIEESDSDKGVITINFYLKDECYIFEVIDNGKPIDDSSMLFKAFNSTKKKGSGLGLVLCESIVRAHGGIIKFIGNDPKCFLINIPIERIANEN